MFLFRRKGVRESTAPGKLQDEDRMWEAVFNLEDERTHLPTVSD